MRFAFVRDHRRRWPVEVLCDVLKVSRSGFYAWLRRPPSRSAERRLELTAVIRQVHEESRRIYGSPRVHQELTRRGVDCCENTAAGLMRDHGIRARTRRRFVPRTTDSRHARPIAENVLARDFTPDRRDAAWAADITYIPTAEGWLYLAVVLDLFSRRIVGWSAADHLRAELCVSAMEMALGRRRPAGGLLHHSDRGVQYASEAFRAVLAGRGIEPSMSRRGDCWDNAVAESFFATLKKELTHHESYATREEARRSLFEYIEVFYNRARLHSTLGYMSPADYEAANPT